MRIFGASEAVNITHSGNASLLDRLELESLMVNIDASFRVHGRHHLFTWSQGLLQNLIKHEALICGLRDIELASFQVDSFASPAVEPAVLSDAFCQDATLVPHLVKTWEDNRFQPVVCELAGASAFPHSALARELGRIGADVIFAHGTYDVFGKLASFFTFASRAPNVSPNQLYFVELIVPFIHLAWTRIKIDRPAEIAGATSSGSGLLTSREQEILKWIHIGKSNIEIGLILSISPLTVKNHVQNILRKLNVQNRTQAVGKGLALRIIDI